MPTNAVSRICFCDPFLFSGLLPTLAAATLASAAKNRGYETRIFYPSIEFFVRNQLHREKALSLLVDDIPLQLSELFFSEDTSEVFARNIDRRGASLSDADVANLCDLRCLAQQAIDALTDRIAEWEPDLFCYSFTFGGYQFAERLFRDIKAKYPDTVIVAGGSNCTPDFAEKLLRQFSQIDYVLCDETPDTLLLLANQLKKGSISFSRHIFSRSFPAEDMLKIRDMDSLPCPDFDDYFALLRELNVNHNMVTLPYEIARGCWWAEKNPCTMCGFFGNHTCYSQKSSGKVVSELTALSRKYSVKRFRFSDLVQPHNDYLKELLPLEHMGLKLFWELRPDLNQENIALLRKVGLTFGQVGIESLSAPALEWMHKGTSVLQNIYVLIQAGTYKIDLVWNYLYGAPEETPAWYEGVAELISKLHHLQPPVPRKIWVNRHSKLFDAQRKLAESAERHLEDIFLQGEDMGMCASHQVLLKAIAQWHAAYKDEAALYIAVEDDFLGVIRGNKYSDERIPLGSDEMNVYLYYGSPHSLAEGATELGIKHQHLAAILDRFIDGGIMVAESGKFLALATGHSPYRWTKSEEQVLYLGDRMFF